MTLSVISKLSLRSSVTSLMNSVLLYKTETRVALSEITLSVILRVGIKNLSEALHQP